MARLYNEKEIGRKTEIDDIHLKFNQGKATREDKQRLQELLKQTRLISALTRKRNNKIDFIFHHVTKTILDFCIMHDVDKVAIGYNKNWKVGVKFRKKDTQNFIQIPFLKLVNTIKYKCEERGIEVVEVNEGYTSKCSFLDNETITKKKKYMGTRICRGLYKSSNGMLINADVNASYNIIKKAFPKARFDLGDGIGGLIHPVVVPLQAVRHESTREPREEMDTKGRSSLPSPVKMVG